jgi:hypothetical protein
MFVAIGYKGRWWFCIFALFLLTLQGCAKKEEKAGLETAAVSGTVKLQGAADHSGVLVELVGTAFSTTTKADGSFSLPGIPPGPYTLKVSKKGFTSKEVVLDIEAGKSIVVPQIVLEPFSVVIGKATMAGVEDHSGIKVSLIKGEMSYSTVTGMDGSYRFEVPPGDYKLIAEKEGYDKVEMDVKVTAGETEIPEIKLFLALTPGIKDVKVGAIHGDKEEIVRTALDRIGANYEIIFDFRLDNLKRFDAITMAIRAYKAGRVTDPKALLEYVKQGGYLFTLDGQADEAWSPEFMPYPFVLTDNDFPQIDAALVEMTVPDHPIWNIPNKITPRHIEAIGKAHWAVYDYAKEVPPPWKILLKTGGFPAVYEAKYGKGTVIFNSVLVGETLSKVELKEAIEIGQNLIYYAKILKKERERQ